MSYTIVAHFANLHSKYCAMPTCSLARVACRNSIVISPLKPLVMHREGAQVAGVVTRLSATLTCGV